MTQTGPIRLGLAGLGRAGWAMHCQALAGRPRQFRIVAACDVLPDRRKMAAAAFGCKTYEDIGELVADPDIELVDIATRSIDHYPHAVAALRAGKDVFLEKPIALTYAQAKRLKRVAEKAGGNLYPCHNRRFEPAFLHVREIIASGLLGDVFEIKLRRVGYSRRDDWQTLIRYGGGQLLNWGPHIIDHALLLLESPVNDMWSDLKRVVAAGDAEDHLKIVLRGENRRIVDIEISGGAAVGGPEYLLWGTRGGLTADNSSISLRYLDPRRKLGPRESQSGTLGIDMYGTPDTLRWIERTIPVKPKTTYDIWDELYKAIRKGAPFPITLDQAVAVMKVVSAAKKGTPFAHP